MLEAPFGLASVGYRNQREAEQQQHHGFGERQAAVTRHG